MGNLLYHLRICIRILLLDDLTGLVDRAVQNVFQEDDTAFTGGHGAVSQ